MTEPFKFNAAEDDISVNRYDNGKWHWKIVFVTEEDCYYNDDMYDTPGEAAEAAWLFILEAELKGKLP